MTNSMISELLGSDMWERVETLTGDASPRKYHRLWKPDGSTAILAEYPRPIRHQLERDLEVFLWCRRQGLRVPEIMASDPVSGCVLLEDLGATDAESTLKDTPRHRRLPLVEGMLRPLEVLARCAPEDLPPWNPPLDRARLRWELAGCELWYLRHLRSVTPSPDLSRWLDDLADEVGRHPVRVCHRDYHLNNLLIQDDGGVGVIDIQDILSGPDTYDVVSLVAERAATRLISEDERHRVLEAWANQTRADPGWRLRAEAVQIQRGLKVLGTFARFTVAGRREYRAWLSELAQNLEQPLVSRGTDPRILALLTES